MGWIKDVAVAWMTTQAYRKHMEAYGGAPGYGPAPAPCLDCGQTEVHAESCGLLFGDEFAQRTDEVEVK